MLESVTVRFWTGVGTCQYCVVVFGSVPIRNTSSKMLLSGVNELASTEAAPDFVMPKGVAVYDLDEHTPVSYTHLWK